MTRAALSYDQAPPLAAPMNLFIVAPLFLASAGIGGALHAGEWLASRWAPAALALTHLITLGFLGLVMVGSLLQIMPVLLGVPVPQVRLVSLSALAGLGLGTPALVWGLYTMQPAWLLAGATLIVAGLLLFLIGLFAGLLRGLAVEWVAWPVRLAWLALLLTLTVGATLAGTLAGLWQATPVGTLTGLHAAWGLGGWVLILVVGIAFHVVPMLQLTPAYSTTIVRFNGWLLAAALAIYSLAALLPHSWTVPVATVAETAGAAGALWFAGTTLRLQAARRRRVADTTLRFWQLGLANLIMAALLLPALHILPPRWQDAAELTLGLFFLIGFAGPIVFGMLHKIVPFLAWFHLQTQLGIRAGRIPNVKELMPEARARRQLHAYQTAVALLVPAPWLPTPWGGTLATLGSAALTVSALLLWISLLRVRRSFIQLGGQL